MNSPDIPRQELIDLEAQINAIYNTYIDGNKATARELFALLPDTRKAYAGVALYLMGLQRGQSDAIYRFINSVTV